MQKIRINDLARELEVKSKAILDALVKVGVTEKKTHSSSIEVDEAERVKKYFAEHAEPSSSSRASRAAAPAERVQAQDRLVAYLQTWRCAESRRAKGRPELRGYASVRAPERKPRLRAPRQTVAPPSAVPVQDRRLRLPSRLRQPMPPAVPVEPPKPAPRFITPQTVFVRRLRSLVAQAAGCHRPVPQAHAPSAVEAARPSEPLIEDQVAVLEEAEVALAETEAG